MIDSMAKEPHDLTLPPAFSGPGQLLLYTRYGDPRATGWEHKWITQWDVQKDFPWFPVQQLTIHKHFWPILENAFKALQQAGMHKEIKTVNDCYHVRTIGESDTVLSVHSWGAALDMNAEDNPTGSMGTWSPGFIDIMETHSITCGQNWEGRKAPMHFSMVNG